MEHKITLAPDLPDAPPFPLLTRAVTLDRYHNIIELAKTNHHNCEMRAINTHLHRTTPYRVK